MEFVLTNDFLARLTAQTSRKSGLSAVYSEILDFDGHEIYFHPPEGLVGRTFGEAIFAFSDAIPIGIQRPVRSTPARTKQQAREISMTEKGNLDISQKNEATYEKLREHMRPPSGLECRAMHSRSEGTLAL